MKYFLDTEFHEYEKEGRIPTIDLISIGIVAEDGRELYLISADFAHEDAWQNEWLRENVLKKLYGSHSLTDLAIATAREGWSRKSIARKILEFIGQDAEPEFYGYYADYDWVVFCWLFGRMIDLPKGFPMYCRDLKQMFDEHCQPYGKEADDYPKQQNEHNALDDARWNLELHRFIVNRF